MSSNSGSVSSPAASQSLDATIHPFLNTLILSHTFLSLLVPLVISLFYFSTPQSRWRPLFILNLISVLLAFVLGVLTDGLTVSSARLSIGEHMKSPINTQIHSILEPLNPWPEPVNLALGFITVWQSILVDLTLLLRVIFVYPPSHVGPIRFALLIAIPVLLKFTRAINIIIFMKALVDAMNGPNAAMMLAIVYTTTPYLKIEWAAQMIDNTYASVVFLWKLRERTTRITTNSSRGAFVFRFSTFNPLIKFISSLFVFVQFVSVYHNIDPTVLDQLILVNTMLATFGVAFATIWSGSTNRREEQLFNSKRNNSASHMMAVFTAGDGRVVNRSAITTSSSLGYVESRDEK
ncbi:hypothetical protein J3R83DRAFT_4065 [Lanmaoa asiatica]|nr:hypothetical protein J3R83DRAFT_4065 [Lanmaoa asiatica]